MHNCTREMGHRTRDRVRDTGEHLDNREGHSREGGSREEGRREEGSLEEHDREGHREDIREKHNPEAHRTSLYRSRPHPTISHARLRLTSLANSNRTGVLLMSTPDKRCMASSASVMLINSMMLRERCLSATYPMERSFLSTSANMTLGLPMRP